MDEQLLFLNDKTVMDHLDIEELLEVIERALADFSAGNIVQPVRSAVPIQSVNGRLFIMPAHYASAETLATKLVAFFPKNSTLNLPSHMATIILMDPATGKLQAIMEGDEITGWRTAAASVVATKCLANSFNILAVLGSGKQAKTHAILMARKFPFKEVFVWNHNYKGAEQLCEYLKCRKIVAKPCLSVEEAVKHADVIVTATSSSSPILQAQWVKPGAHINSVGACRPDWREMSKDLMKNADVWTDSAEAALKESGDIILSEASILGEIGDIINKKKVANKSATTIFKSLGMAAEDAAAARLVFRNYQKTKL